MSDFFPDMNLPISGGMSDADCEYVAGLKDAIEQRDKVIERLLEEAGCMRHGLELIADRDELPADDHETISLRAQEIAMQILSTLT